MDAKNFRPGLFRHFKGSIFFADTLMKGEDGEWCVHYCHALEPTMWFSRPLSEWDIDVTDRIGKDNITEQTHRFERISSFAPTARDVSTEQLVRELAQREDSPLHGLDLECLTSSIAAVDYCVGTFCPASKECKVPGVYTHAAFDTKKGAYDSSSLRSNLNSRVYKRTFIEV